MLTRLARYTNKGWMSRCLHQSSILSKKNDSSTIDSYKFPSHTSLHEWDFKYDFIPKETKPKIPSLTREAVNQDIAQEKKSSVEKELGKEEMKSVKAEANASPVVHDGKIVTPDPEHHPGGSEPIDASHKGARGETKEKRPVNREKYVQSSLNPDVNKSEVSNMGEKDIKHHSF